MSVNLGSFERDRSIPCRGPVVRALWIFGGAPAVRNSWLPGTRWRVSLLRGFGATIASGVIIKPGVRIKFPWKLEIGENSWVGEDCWIDNLAPVRLGANVCISQGCYLCTGNHDWKSRSFRMFAKPIILEDGSWVASRCTVGPGVTIGRDAIAAIGSVVLTDIPEGHIYGGNPCSPRGLRKFADMEEGVSCDRDAGGSRQGLVRQA